MTEPGDLTSWDIFGISPLAMGRLDMKVTLYE
jgi:hypothetical protein